jgi:predicted nuclease with TOPRIM domain
MENYEEKEPIEEDEFHEIATEISKLSEEVEELKENLKAPKKKEAKEEKTKKKKQSSTLELDPAIQYVNELLENSSDVIISEMKSEFFRLFNFLSSMFSVSPYQQDRRKIQRKPSESSEGEAGVDSSVLEDFQREKDMLNLLLEERESLIYELSDQIVAIEAEKKDLEDKMEKISVEMSKWMKQKSVLERIVTTDPRFNIINLLRRMGVIAPIQLSFVLGVSLSQTRKYISELEQMKILSVNEDGTVSLHPEFDEETMNIRINNQQ